MNRVDMLQGCSLENQHIQTILENINTRHYAEISLKELIDGYYDVYCKAYDLLEKFKEKIIRESNHKMKDIIKFMRIDNLVMDNRVYRFDFVSDYPISFRLPFTFNCEDRKLDFAGEKKDCLSYYIVNVSYSKENLSDLEGSLNSFMIINKNCMMNLKDSLPYIVCFDHDRVSICNADDTSNNIVPLVDMDLKNSIVSFDESIANNEFSVMFKDYLLLILENAYVDRDDVREKLGHIGYGEWHFVDVLLIKDYKTQQEEKILKEKEPKGAEIYYLNVPNEGYKLISDYRCVRYNQERNCYTFEFFDFSFLSIPASEILFIDIKHNF